MNRLRRNSRIQPVRPYWSRGKLLAVVAACTAALLLSGTAWLQRTEQAMVDLSPAGPYWLESSAGPIAVSTADQATLRYRSSWLLRGPKTELGGRKAPAPPSQAIVDCQTRFPCRVGAEIEVPAASDLTVRAADNDVLVDRFDGVLTIESTGSGQIVLGPVAGSINISSQRAPVYGSGLTATDVEIRTESGEIDLWFSQRPQRLVIHSGSEPVTVKLPDGDYAVSVRGGSSIVVTVGQRATADGEIQIQARGPVRIEPTE